MSGVAEFPPYGLMFRARAANSGVLWMIGIFGAVVLAGDLVVAVQWMRAGRPDSALFAVAGAVLLLCSLMAAIAAWITLEGLRRQRYAMTARGLMLSWRTSRLDLLVPWAEIRAMSRRYERAPGGNAMGIAVFVVDPERYLEGGRASLGSPMRAAGEHQREHGTPIYLDLTEVAGGTVRFFEAARWYAARAGKTDLLLD